MTIPMTVALAGLVYMGSFGSDVFSVYVICDSPQKDLKTVRGSPVEMQLLSGMVRSW